MKLHAERRWGYIFALAVTLATSALILVYFHNRFWWPPDEGAYAHTAERILRGEALNSQVEEIHTGYLNFLHAGAFAVFGLRLVSLRYPLVFVAFIQSILVFVLLANRNVLVAAIAAIGAIALGVPQFLNPQPSWYCLFLVTLIAFCFSFFSKDRWWRLFLIGLLVGLVFFLRQVTGVFVAMGVVTYVLLEDPNSGKSSRALIAKATVVVMAIGTTAYLTTATDAFGFVLIGFWPLALLTQAFFTVRTANREAITHLARLGVGVALAAFPIVVYHIWHHSVATFIDDTLLRALAVSKFSYLREASYLTAQTYGLENVIDRASWTTIVNGAYWFALPFFIPIVGFLVVINLRKISAVQVGALPILAVFYAMVALLQQIPIYLFYTLPITLAALFWLTLTHRTTKVVLGGVTVVISGISLYWQAGQPVTRNLGGIVRGERIALEPATPLERAGLRIDSQSLLIYSELVQRIKSSSEPDETIFALPNNPELYFLSDRRNPFRFWNSAIGIRNQIERDQVLFALQHEPPRLIVFAGSDRNNTQYSKDLMTYVRQNYRLLTVVSHFEIYESQLARR